MGPVQPRDEVFRKCGDPCLDIAIVGADLPQRRLAFGNDLLKAPPDRGGQQRRAFRDHRVPRLGSPIMACRSQLASPRLRFGINRAHCSRSAWILSAKMDERSRRYKVTRSSISHADFNIDRQLSKHIADCPRFCTCWEAKDLAFFIEKAFE
jgi:hypothetical protein